MKPMETRRTTVAVKVMVLAQNHHEMSELIRERIFALSKIDPSKKDKVVYALPVWKKQPYACPVWFLACVRRSNQAFIAIRGKSQRTKYELYKRIKDQMAVMQCLCSDLWYFPNEKYYISALSKIMISYMLTPKRGEDDFHFLEDSYHKINMAHPTTMAALTSGSRVTPTAKTCKLWQQNKSCKRSACEFSHVCMWCGDADHSFTGTCEKDLFASGKYLVCPNFLETMGTEGRTVFAGKWTRGGGGGGGAPGKRPRADKRDPNPKGPKNPRKKDRNRAQPNPPE